jgi:hypothetical protein
MQDKEIIKLIADFFETKDQIKLLKKERIALWDKKFTGEDCRDDQDTCIMDVGRNDAEKRYLDGTYEFCERCKEKMEIYLKIKKVAALNRGIQKKLRVALKKNGVAIGQQAVGQNNEFSLRQFI